MVNKLSQTELVKVTFQHTVLSSICSMEVISERFLDNLESKLVKKNDK